MHSLRGSQTAENLLKAFAGESQARNRYTYYAGQAKKEGYHQISAVFLETAENELIHAERFFGFLSEVYQGESIGITAEYPTGYSNTLKNLTYAVDGEHEEWMHLYPMYAEIARKEGFEEIADCFHQITKAERYHEQRFQKLHNDMTENCVFERKEEVEWKCRKCGFVHRRTSAPQTCPSCLHPREYFEVCCPV